MAKAQHSQNDVIYGEYDKATRQASLKVDLCLHLREHNIHFCLSIITLPWTYHASTFFLNLNKICFLHTGCMMPECIVQEFVVPEYEVVNEIVGWLNLK